MKGYGSDNTKSDIKQRHGRYSDGIIWGVLASLSLFFMNPYAVFPTTLLFAAFAGYRGKSARPALGVILTVFIFGGIGFIWLYISLSGINN